MLKCEICGCESDHRTHVAREMMFGWRDEFTYLECNECGCLSNITVPADLGRYYGSGYYSLGEQPLMRSRARDLLKAQRTKAYLGEPSWLGAALLSRFGPPALPDWVTHAKVKQGDRILEVGCGRGHLLLALRSEGFRDLHGTDPFIDADIDHGNGLHIRKRRVAEVTETFDVVILEHSFEHIPNQQELVRDLLRLVLPGGVLIVSLPLANWARRNYGVNWVQLDAPRHLFLHTERSFRALIGDDASIEVHYDSGAFQFWGSEQYARGIPLLDPRSHRVGRRSGLFSEADLSRFETEARKLNEQGRGDQATFIVRPHMPSSTMKAVK